MKQIMFLLFFIFLSFTINAQITTQQARPVDSALVAQYQESGNFHTTNYHDLPGGSVFTWDAGNGLNVDISEYAVAWSHSGRVADTLAVMINSTPGQAYKLFDLAFMPDIYTYSDSVTHWLGSLGIPVGLLQFDAEKLAVRANRTGVQLTFPENGQFELLIFNIEGKRLHIETGKAVAGTSKIIALKENYQGILLIQLQINDKQYSAKVLNRRQTGN